MPELALSPRTALDHIAPPGRYGTQTGAAGVFITLISKLALASIMARAAKAADLSVRAAGTFGVALPVTPKRVDGGSINFIWAGPDQWLAATEGNSGYELTNHLRRNFAGLASVTDQSDGRIIIRVAGAKIRQTLAKGVPVDLDPHSFGVGDTALTIVGHINAHFWQLDGAPTFEFAVFRSFANAFCEWLKQAGAEFGVTVTSAR